MTRILLILNAAYFALVPDPISAEPPHTKILLIGTQPDHPFRSHMYMFECTLLAKCLEQTPDVETVVSLDWPQDPQLLDDVKSIVFYSRPAGDIVLAPQNRDVFLKRMSDGVGYVAIHWATGADQRNKADYLNVLGGWFQRPPCGLKTTTSQLVQIEPAHPICHGWKDYDLHDEFYLDLVFHQQTQPLIKVNVDGKDQVVGWVFERPDSNGGRSFGTTLGHFHENFTRPEFRQAIVNGILWTAHRDIPAAGAPVALGPADVTLPPPDQKP